MAQTLNFFVLNIKLLSDKEGSERTQAYIDLFSKLTTKPYSITALLARQKLSCYMAL